MSREVAEIARRAADIIQQRGKATGTMRDESGAVCMWGALQAAEPDATFLASPIYVTLRESLARMFPSGLINYYEMWPGSTFNDLPGTTDRDVAKTLLQLADEVEVQ